MRIRSIKPEFWHSESLSRVSREARLLFIGIFSACDDSGRTRAASRFLASLLYPYDEDAPKRISGWLDELEKEGCVRRYTNNGDHYLDIPKWSSHQKIDKPSPSKLPPFADNSRGLADNSRTFVVGSGIRDQGSREQGGGTDCPADAGPRFDFEWLETLKANPAYQHINVNAEMAKMRTWCDVNKKQPTRRRFVNWLNRIEKPLQAAPREAYGNDYFERRDRIEREKAERLANEAKAAEICADLLEGEPAA